MALEVIISIFTAVMVTIVTALVTKMWKNFSKLHNEFDTLKESQRNQLKASIVRTYEDCKRNSGISALELETLNRRYESYKKLGGNSYIDAVVNRLNNNANILIDEDVHV